MREIIFRGKRKDNGEWNFGFYFQKQNPYSADGVTTTHHISELPPFGVEVDPETVGQYTGMTDKIGKKIFEGDILDVIGVTYVCRWDDCNFEFGVSNEKESFGLAYISPQQIEVIGNIHDNQELLQVHKDGEGL